MSPRPQPTRAGSFLLICLGLMAMAVILGIAYLRNMRIRTETGTSTRRVLLAREAARTGLRHAIEEALANHAMERIDVGSDTGSPTSNVPALTFLDGPWQAPFTAIASPYRCYGFGGADTNAWDVDKDVRHEHLLTYPWLPWQDGDWGAMRFAWYAWEGTQHFCGRGRYLEPEFYNRTRRASGTPTAAVSFVDRAPGLPERNQGLFLDEDFCRIDSGDPIRDRQAARYRLRYTVGIEDLQGHLLVNPVGDFQGSATYREPEPWLARARDAFGGIMASADRGFGMATWEHIFLGRGWSGNCDLRDDGVPATFPLMYRSSDPGHGHPPWSQYRPNWGDQNHLSAPNQLYASTSVTGNPAGGEELWATQDVTWGVWPGECNNGRYTHAKMGPIRSWQGLYFAFTGASWLRAPNLAHTMFTLSPYGRPLRRTPGYPGDYNPVARRWHEGRVDTPFYLNVLTTPPAVFRDVLNAYWPKVFRRTNFDRITFEDYGGRDADNHEIFGPHLGPDGTQVTMPINPWDPRNQWKGGRDLLVATSSPAFQDWPAPRRDGASNPPLLSGTPVVPDYYVDDNRPLDEVYPGPLMNGDSANPGEGSDDLGALINASNDRSDTIPGLMWLHNDWRGYFWKVGKDVHIDDHWLWDKGLGGRQEYRVRDLVTYATNPDGTPAVDADGKPIIASRDTSRLTVEPPESWWDNPDNRCYKSARLTTDSYCWDLAAAFMSAVNITRAQWVQYDNPQVRVDRLFDAGRRRPEIHRTLRDLDRLFLAQLGESLDNPGSGTPADLGLDTYPAIWQDWGDGGRWTFRQVSSVASSRYAPQHNIRSLKDGDLLRTDGGATSADRAAVMELLLNDFRMSFLGASPDYSDPVDPDSLSAIPADEFRPLDFDGDDLVHCSAYEGGVAADEGDGRGPRPAADRYFSITGCFFIGKSRYFRIWTRGEIWDNLTGRILNEASLQSVVAIDPEGRAHPDPRATSTTDHQILHQRWIFDKYQGQLSRVKR